MKYKTTYYANGNVLSITPIEDSIFTANNRIRIDNICTPEQAQAEKLTIEDLTK